MAEIRCGHKTDVGRAREVNQDSVTVLRCDGMEGQADALIVVADGMGGRAGGEIAACLTTQALPPAVRAHLWSDHGERTRETFADALVAGIAAANAAVWKRGREEPALRGMGTTCVSLLVRDDLAVIGNAGDSRVYLLRMGDLRQVTHDHVLIYDSKIAALDSEGQPQSRFHNTITRAIGFAAAVQPDITLARLTEGDRLLLCSDGLTNMVDDSEIAALLCAEPDPQSACEQLVAMANDHGGEDNVTVALLDYGRFRSVAPSPSRPVAADDEQPVPLRKRAPQRIRWWILTAAAVLVAGLAVTLLFLIRHR